MQTMAKRMKLLRRVWLLICLIGLISQTIMVTQQYLKFDTITQVMIEYEKKFHPPSFSYCVQVHDIMIMDRIQRDGLCLLPNPEECNIECRKNCMIEIKSIIERSSNSSFWSLLNKLYDNYTMSLWNPVFGWRGDGSMEKFFIQKRLENDLHSSVNTKVLLKCVREDSRNWIQLRFGWDNIMFWLNPQDIEWRNLSIPVWFYIHEAGLLPRFMHSPGGMGIGNSSLLIPLSYRPYLSLHEPMPNHYCIDYRTMSRFESREHCKEEVDRIGSHNKCLSENNSSIDCNSLSMLKGSLSLAKIAISQPEVARCPHSCSNNFYHTYIVSKQEQHDAFIIVQHLNPTTRVIFSQNLTLLEYLIYMASLTSLWFGFVIFDTFKLIINHLIVKKVKKSNRSTLVSPAFIRISNRTNQLILNQN